MTILGMTDEYEGEIRLPCGGRLLSGAEVRITIHPLPLFGFRVKFPLYVAPAAKVIVSPSCALSSAL